MIASMMMIDDDDDDRDSDCCRLHPTLSSKCIYIYTHCILFIYRVLYYNPWVFLYGIGVMKDRT